MPSWLGDGLAVTVLGMGMVFLTLFLLWQILLLLGRVLARSEVDAGEIGPRGAVSGTGAQRAAGLTGLRDTGGTESRTAARAGAGEAAVRRSRKAKSDGARLAAIAAAVTAYMEDEARAQGRGPRPFRIAGVQPSGPGSAQALRGTEGPFGGDSGRVSSVWAQAGRLELMFQRRQSMPRKGRSST